jgi:hypothetical protein
MHGEKLYKSLIKCQAGTDGRWKYIYSLLTRALEGGGWSTPGLSRFTPRKETIHPLNRRLIGLQGRPGGVRKISPVRGFEPWTFQRVATCYTAELWGRYTKAPTPRFLKLRLRLLHKSSIRINNGKPIRHFIATTWIIRLLFRLITYI